MPAHIDTSVVRAFDYHTDAAFLEDPYAGFDRMRGDRVFFSTQYGGYWVLTRADDIRNAFQHPEIFSSREFSIPSRIHPRTLRPLALDPPEHGRYRQPLAPMFSPTAVAQREPMLRALCANLVDGFVADGSCDLLDALARPFPTTVFVSMLGLPIEQAGVLEEWNHDLLHAYEEPERRASAAKHILAFLDDIVVKRMDAGPEAEDDLFSVLLRARVDGRPLSQEEVLDYAFTLFMAGLDTVTAVLGFTFHCLAERPDLQLRLRTESAIVSSAVEEMLRVHAIVNTARVVTTDVEFAGVQMRAGDRVLLATALATRDPHEFERADEVLLDRADNRHLAFGAGPHRCIGSHLARLEMRIAIEELHRRVPAYRLQDCASVVVHGGGVLGIDRLPIEWATGSR